VVTLDGSKLFDLVENVLNFLTKFVYTDHVPYLVLQTLLEMGQAVLQFCSMLGFKVQVHECLPYARISLDDDDLRGPNADN
jgi:hypothetical protein